MRERIALDPVDSGEASTLIDDAYNANPASMAAASRALLARAQPTAWRASAGRRIAVLGDMLELGPTRARNCTRASAGVSGRQCGGSWPVHAVGPTDAATCWEALSPRPGRPAMRTRSAAELGAQVRCS
ncbi:MAG: hypothetical protein MZV49_08710 [Rhodopseudomonas palustris]|nr:hypothetical protein [Rhodopseudomonas palustris]